MSLNIILAIDKHHGLAKNDQIPWYIKEDLQYFRQVTTSSQVQLPNVIIMGRKTADTLSNPLKNRINYVVTKQATYRTSEQQEPQFYISNNYQDLIIKCLQQQHEGQWGDIFIIGGKQVVDLTLNYPNLVKTVYLTKIDYNYHCNVEVSNLVEFVEQRLNLVSSETKTVEDLNLKQPVKIDFQVWSRSNKTTSEQAYLDVLLELLKRPARVTRNGFTHSYFGHQLVFDLKQGFPALTTKRLYWKGVVNELLFFLGGQTDNQWLREREVYIWNGNTTSEFIQKTGLPYQENDLGPMYGYQFRYYGQPYQNKNERIYAPERDQLLEVVNLLQKDPFSRRIIMTSYNYAQVKEGVLYPCHGLVIQFYVHSDYTVDCQMYQRSADWFLGVPFNIASYALLLHIIINYLNHHPDSHHVYQPGRVLMTFGDYHLYQSHQRQALLQAGRFPKKSPQIEITQPISSIEPDYFLNLDWNIFKLVGYQPEPAIKADMVA